MCTANIIHNIQICDSCFMYVMLLSYIYIDFRVKFLLFSSDFNKNLNFNERFSKFSRRTNAMKPNPSKTELFHTNGQRVRKTDMCFFLYLFLPFSFFFIYFCIDIVFPFFLLPSSPCPVFVLS